ncbi:hypothetical protein BC943DRAFT_314718 [Umbelopsis sp. AD052]|nr:hypothetical protein BC943DRAFT_314718 [Umbelopsis sp. AD052]
MGIGWAVDTNPSQVYDMPPRPELSSRGTIVNRDRDHVAHYYRDAQRYPSPLTNESSYRNGEGGSSRDPRISHYQSGIRESARGSHSNYSSPSGGYYSPPIHYTPAAPKLPDFYSRPNHHPSRTPSASDRYESPSPQTQPARKDKGKASSHPAEGSSRFGSDRYDTSHRNNDRPRISSREASREPVRRSPPKEPTAAQVTKWNSTPPSDPRQLSKYTCGKSGILKNPKTMVEYERFAQAIKNNKISWETPTVLAIDFVYDVPVFPSPSVSSLQKSAPPPPASGDDERAHKKSKIEPTSNENERNLSNHSNKHRSNDHGMNLTRNASKHSNNDRSDDHELNLTTNANKHSNKDRSNDHETNSTRNSRIDSSSTLATSSNGSTNGHTDVHVARPLATMPAAAATTSTDLAISTQRKIKNTITVINAILDDGGYCYMPYRAFEKSYDRLRVNMSPAMTGSELNFALQSDLQTEVSSFIVLTMFPGNPLARYIRLKRRDIKHRRSQEDENIDIFRQRFISEASKIVFPETVISIHALVYLMESLKPDPLSDVVVRQRLGQIDVYDFLISSSSGWTARHMGYNDRELVTFNTPNAEPKV